jgi:hypothetical protein
LKRRRKKNRRFYRQCNIEKCAAIYLFSQNSCLQIKGPRLAFADCVVSNLTTEDKRSIRKIIPYIIEERYAARFALICGSGFRLRY